MSSTFKYKKLKDREKHICMKGHCNHFERDFTAYLLGKSRKDGIFILTKGIRTKQIFFEIIPQSDRKGDKGERKGGFSRLNRLKVLNVRH